MMFGAAGPFAFRALCRSACRVDMVKVSRPTRRVFTTPVASHLGPIQNGFDPTPQSRREFRLLFPNRIEHPCHVRRIDIAQRYLADPRTDMGKELASSLIAILPSHTFMFREVPGHSLIEGQ